MALVGQVCEALGEELHFQQVSAGRLSAEDGAKGIRHHDTRIDRGDLFGRVHVRDLGSHKKKFWCNNLAGRDNGSERENPVADGYRRSVANP